MTHGFPLRLRDGLHHVLLEVDGSPRDRSSIERSSRALEALLWRVSSRDPEALRVLAAVHERLTGLGRQPAAARLHDELRLAARTGRLNVRRVERRAISLPVREEEVVLGPEPIAVEQDFIRVLFYDSTGQPIPSDLDPLPAHVEVRVSGGPTFPLPFAAGMADVAAIAPGFPSACRLAFSGLAGDEPVPPSAPPAVDVAPAAALVRGPLAATVLVTRRQLLASAQAGTLDTTNVFQLRRRDADVVELEHFLPGSAVLLPGDTPEAIELRPDAPRMRGIDALSACLRDAVGAPPASILVVGHDPSLSKERAGCVRALLVADRDAWLAIVQAHSQPGDVQSILRWASQQFGWPCDPGAVTGVIDTATTRAVRAFQGSYDGDLDAGLFPAPATGAEIAIDGVMGPQTWGAMFDCIQRALHPVQKPTPGTLAYILVDDKHQTYPVELAQIAAPGQDANRWTDLDGPNPLMVLPNGGGWRPPQVGQRIYIPPTWDLQALRDAGYVAVDATPASLPPPAGPPPIAADGLRAIGCGAHHVDTPDAGGRRAVHRHVDVVFVDPDAPPPVVTCGAGSGPCKAKDCELYDPREYDLAYVPLDATIPAGGFIDFFVYRDDEDGADGGVAIASDWGLPLRLGWAIQGDVQQISIHNDAVGRSVDVTRASRLRADGTTMGWLPLVALPDAADHGVVTYRMTVVRPGGPVDFEPRVRVTVAGAPPAHEPWMFIPLAGAPDAHVMGFGRTGPHPPRGRVGA